MDAFLIGGRSAKKVVSDSSKPSSSEKTRTNIPWVEKYRPKTVSEVAFQDEVVAVLKKTLQGADLPNLLFYGPPGTGKTSTILAAARELFGKELYKTRVLELNASDERGISVIREKVKNFSQLAASGTTADGRSCPAFKIIILDEADSMTNDAQAALRRTMEKQTKTTRFCLICNYVSRIIDPLTSRCTKFRFKPLTKDIQLSKLKEICKAESVECSDEVLEAIIASTEGDLRKAITYLQSAHRLHGEDGITVGEINEIAGVVPQDVIGRLQKACYTGSYDNLETVVREVLQDGYAAYQLLLQFHDAIVVKEDLTDKQKSAITDKLAIVDKRLCDGAEEYLQMMDMFTFIMDQFCINSED